jgi:hypothetical protein
MNFIENIRIQLILTIFLLWFGNSTLLAQEFACTHVIGFSQTRGWFSDTDTFENIVIDGNWQLIWQGGAGVDQWRNPNYGGWNQNIISSCTQNSNAPDRILLTISGPYGADEGAWAEAIQETIDNIRIKYPSVQEILLQPVVGGPNHEDCFLNGTALIRASWQHKHIDNAIATLVGGDVLQGFSPEVNDCSDYVDQTGHLTTIGYENAATNIGSYYSENGNSSPVIFNGNPSGTLPSGTSDINLSVETNEIADCSYSMVADTDFNDMTPFLETSALFHSTPVTGLEDGNSYTYFVRCQDQEGNTNTIDFPIGFTIGAPSTDLVDLSGTFKTVGGTDICAMVLASGQFMFSCNPAGVFSLTDLPRENDGTAKRQIYADGFFPKIDTLTGSTSEAVVMTQSGPCPMYNPTYLPAFVPGSAGKRINISGSVLLQNTQTPICAMVLANGQYMFSCDGTGSYARNIPLDTNGQFKLQVYADGFAPTIQTFDEFQAINDVRMARAVECQ